ncbi:MAG TPA: glycine cleavage system protein GcvH [Bacteroidales bacterium]|jgi:glycine cleavage system H protein|nr:glycine cleavage system protein GcvH [Bacteroidales bacterium]OPZ97106.1 MAG: Glycine cleavage system H protein [Bacteroidetes bacterium ADurb.Bin408]HNZ42555.1 glycine cleavage system protein GcvH [Bacteroidales bacterium]HOH83433.1 glycine cleavage system protein GcvH [Bacteroidales bacterium]HPB24369.1 glycine cleavage system protein GcvH [Bacteroidales bacterium]
MKIEENLLYTESHEWVRIEGENAYIGISDFAQHELGDIVFVEVDTIGETINKGEAFGTIEAVKTVSDMYLPLSGEILELNPVIETNPETINKDPYGEGWIVKIKLTNPEEAGNLLKPADYAKLVKA